ncbi:MarR family winged helix-turn-helix transcriptional regulator [Variovorax arabinosiphilus]|uniref:MarR family winged helix-turn-helix transcriptional regulator n=1 Tax=Variovorax arabinosiphilus TaxID=3053498 RepID=UPI002574BEF1|nr:MULTISPECIES: MarR family winged helix-turn-helix transcriptional regulator [unclassified Variovorax]MDM0122871.1 MarR family winged helix-turn-helix transcriptional regulator [Variovorax sp. J2L1-78]MDM0132133.1 MarR family winged helix-turn-helix transcriptional regulator [Variovorax sp. J2L1-63]MDM0235634.1 MarR family winged helix-turn-helix transcriptional regulator [Variovorax sp. J2R1-6]
MPHPPHDPSLIDLHDQPGHLIRRAHQISVSVFLDVVGREVTPIQYAVLKVLGEKPGIDQLTLAQEVAIDTSSCADIAARLEAKGWISRSVGVRGRRRLELTTAGEALLDSLKSPIQTLQATLLHGLSAQESADLLNLLRKFVGHNNERSRAPLRRGASKAIVGTAPK